MPSSPRRKWSANLNEIAVSSPSISTVMAPFPCPMAMLPSIWMLSKSKLNSLMTGKPSRKVLRSGPLTRGAPADQKMRLRCRCRKERPSRGPDKRPPMGQLGLESVQHHPSLLSFFRGFRIKLLSLPVCFMRFSDKGKYCVDVWLYAISVLD